jgi:hypothetical protein
MKCTPVLGIPVAWGPTPDAMRRYNLLFFTTQIGYSNDRLIWPKNWIFKWETAYRFPEAWKILTSFVVVCFHKDSETVDCWQFLYNLLQRKCKGQNTYYAYQ